MKNGQPSWTKHGFAKSASFKLPCAENTELPWAFCIMPDKGQRVAGSVIDSILFERTRGPSSIKQTLELLQRQRWGSFWETAMERMWAFPNA